MTLLVVLMLGLGGVLVVSAFETDPATGKSVSVAQTLQGVWAGSVDFTQPGQQQGGPPAQNGGGSAGGFAYTTQTLGASASSGHPSASYQAASLQAYAQQRTRTV